MAIRTCVRRFCLFAAVVIGLTGTAHVSAAEPSTDAEQPATAGIDVSRLPAGWSLVGDELWWEGGAIRSSIEPLDEAALPCPTGYLCLYSDADLQGYRFASSIVGRHIYLTQYAMDSDYTWNDKVSSWVNRRGLDAAWFYHTDQPDPNRCMGVGTGQEHLRTEDNDQMSRFYIFNTTTACP